MDWLYRPHFTVLTLALMVIVVLTGAFLRWPIEFFLVGAVLALAVQHIIETGIRIMQEKRGLHEHKSS